MIQMRYEGTLFWDNGDQAIVRDAIVAVDRIAFDAPFPTGTYHVVLRPDPDSDQWVGSWTSGGQGRRVNARVERIENDVNLRGLWVEVGDYDPYTWELALSLQE
jgi:hypothetical protein